MAISEAMAKDPQPKAWARYKRIYEMRQTGTLLREIAAKEGVSINRIRQILAKYERGLRIEKYRKIIDSLD